MTRTPEVILAREPMGRLQIAALTLCVMLNALDGFDVLSISFASPGIATQWGIDRAALGVVLSAELIGMAVGSLAIGALADLFGRRPAILTCLAVMSGGMFLASGTGDVTTLSLFRLLTGVGIGGMLAATNAMAAELANERRRNLAVALMASGYPLGAAAGGTIASLLLAQGDWREVFLFGGAATALLFPLVLWLMPESVSFLASGRTPEALARVNRVLIRMGHGPADALSEKATRAARNPVTALFAPGQAGITLLLALAYFAHIATFYFILKWVPKIVADMGFPASSAAGVLVWANIGGACGALLLTILTGRLSLRLLVLAALLTSAIMVSLFGHVRADLGQLDLLAGCAGFCTNGAVVGIYALIARYFPTPMRGSGTGFVIGVGRGGAALSPIAAGLMFASGVTLTAVAVCMASGSLIAALALWLAGPVPSHKTMTA